MYRNDHALSRSRHILRPDAARLAFGCLLALSVTPLGFAQLLIETPLVPPPLPPVEFRAVPSGAGGGGLEGGEGGSTLLHSIGNPSDEEQLYVEYLNRSRANPGAEALIFYNTTDPTVLSALNYFNVDRNLMLAQYASIAPAPPLSINAALSAAARAHSLDMLSHNFQGHTGTDGSSPGNRLSRQGYSWQTYGENVYASAKSVFHGHAGFEVDWGFGPGGMQTPAGHRNNIHSPSFREVGVGVALGSGAGVGPQLVTQDLAASFNPKPFITGVAYYDLNGNGAYDIGEGMGGVNVQVGGAAAYAVTTASGGYSVPVAGNGSHSVTFTAPNLAPSAVTATVTGNNNVKVDFAPPYAAPALSGSSTPGAGHPNPYSFTTVGAALTYDWKRSVRSPLAYVEGAEDGLNDSLASATTGGYGIIDSTLRASGVSSFHLAHAEPNMQSLTINRTLTPGIDCNLTFASRLRYATPTQVAQARISTDGGLSWVTVWSRPGSGTSGQSDFEQVTVPLSQFNGQEITIRFAYDFLGGSYYTGAGSSVGWFLDDIALSNTAELTETVVTRVNSGTSFSFTPDAATDYSLRVRPNLSGRSLAWGPALLVTSSASNPVVVTITGTPQRAGNRIRFDFNIQGGTAGGLRVETAPNPAGPWTADPSTLFQTMGSAGQMQAESTMGSEPICFYRIVAN